MSALDFKGNGSQEPETATRAADANAQELHVSGYISVQRCVA
jgi:hypothetical protein